MNEVEIPLTGGWATSGVVRVGDTVRRPVGTNSAFVQRLLMHLEEDRFEAAPRFRGLDERGREVLTFIEGDVPSDCRQVIWSDSQLEAAAILLARFHRATGGTTLATDAEVVCHNDFGPWNLVWRNERPIGIIDFDVAAPGARLDDLGYAVWKHLNLGLVDLSPEEQRRRLSVMAAAYGFAADGALLAAIDGAQERMLRLIDAAPGPTDRDEALSQNQHERSWLKLHGRTLIS